MNGNQIHLDPKKSHSNLLKHGIDFETAAEVFLDPRVAVVFSRREGGEEALQSGG